MVTRVHKHTQGEYGHMLEAQAASGKVGEKIYISEYIEGSGVGGGWWLIVAPATGTPDGGSYLDKIDGNQLEIIPQEGVVYNTQWGTVADGTDVGGTNNSPMLNAAMVYVNANREIVNTLILPQGQHSVEEPIEYLQSVNWIGHSTSSAAAGGTVLICNFSAGTIATPPVNNETGRYSPVLDFTPMIYNTQLLTQQTFGNLRLDCNNKDVYGIYFNEWYYMKNLPVFVINANKAPITLLVGQFNEWDLMTYNGCKAGSRFIGCDTFGLRSLDTESNTVTGSVLDIIHDQAFSTKAGVTIGQWHYEETGTDFPTIFAKICGRNTTVLTSSFGTSGTAPANREIELLGSVAYTFDGVNITTEQSVNTRFMGHSFSAAGSGTFNLNAGATGSIIRCDTSALSNLIDASGNTTNQVDGFTSGQRLPRDTTIRSSTGRMMFFSADDTINFFDNNNRYLKQSGADMELMNTSGRLFLRSGNNSVEVDCSTRFDVDVSGVASVYFDDTVTTDDSAMVLLVGGTAKRVTQAAVDSGDPGNRLLQVAN